jgi:hypothetical protein
MGTLIAGTAEGFHHRAKKGVKGAGVIPAGAVLVPDAALTPDGWKVAPTTATTKPYGILLVQDAATGDTNVTVGIEGEFAVVAGGTIEPNQYVMTDSGTAGRVKVWDAVAETTKVGLYLGHKGGNLPEAAAAADVINIIKEAD